MSVVGRGVGNAGTTDDPLTGSETSGEKVAPHDRAQPMDASETSPREGQECSGTTNSQQANLTGFRCRFCGNVVAREERPTRCYVCRRGENEPPETRLYESLPALLRRPIPDGGPMPRVSVRIPQETLDKMEAVRWERSGPGEIVSRSEILRDAIEWYLEEYVDADLDEIEADGDGDDGADDGDRGDGDDGGSDVTELGEWEETEPDHEEAHEYVEKVRKHREEGQ